MDFAFILLITAALLVRLFFLLQSGNIIDFDEATFALMAKRVLEGEIPLFISGHSYSGSFISFVMAPFIACLGTTPLAIKLASTVLFLIFITLNYFLMKKLFSRRVSLFANLFIAFMPAGVMDVSIRVWGGHAELWSFAAGLLLLLACYFELDQPRLSKNSRLFLIGLTVGAALWIGEIFVLFLLPYLTYFFLRFRPEPDKSLLVWLGDYFLLKNVSIPRVLKPPLFLLHLFIVFFFSAHFLSLLLGAPMPSWFEGIAHFFKAKTPFQIKSMKLIAYLMMGEAVFVFIMGRVSFLERMARIQKVGLIALGFALGHLPALLFNTLGGEGLRIFHKSGSIPFSEFFLRFKDVFLNKFPNFILGLSYLKPPGFDNGQAILSLSFLSLIIFILFSTAVAYRKSFLIFGKMPQGFKPSYLVIFYLIMALTLFGNLISALEATRYLIPCYLALTGILGVFLGEVVWNRSKTLSLFLTFLIAGFFLYTNYEYYKDIPKNRFQNYQEIIQYLEKNNVRGGVASRNISHLLTYLTGEKIVFSASSPKERYLPHEKYIDSLRHKAYVFRETDSDLKLFQTNRALFTKVTATHRVDKFIIYLAEFPQAQGQSLDVSYSEWRPKSHLHFYLNQ